MQQLCQILLKMLISFSEEVHLSGCILLALVICEIQFNTKQTYLQ